jgi:hypothetical protein
MGRTLLNVWAESRRGKRVDKEHSPVLPANVGEGQAHVTESHTIPRVSPQRRSGWNIELLKSDRDVPLITVVCDNREQVPRIEPLRETDHAWNAVNLKRAVSSGFDGNFRRGGTSACLRFH